MEQKSLTPISVIPEYEHRGINVRDYLLVVLKRRWLIITAVSIIVVCAAIYSFVQTPVYQSTSVIYIDRLSYNIVPDVLSEGQFHRKSYDTFFETQYTLLQGRTLARRVQEKLSLTLADFAPADERSEAKAGEKELDAVEMRNQVVDHLINVVRIDPVDNTTLCRISFSTPDPEVSARLANVWADEYINYSLSLQYEYRQRAGALLETQIADLQKEIAEKQKILQDYSRAKQVVKLDNARSMSTRTLEDLSVALSEATRDRIAREVHYRDLQSQRKDAVPEVRNSASVQRLKEVYDALEKEYSEKSNLYHDDYPEMATLKTKLQQTRERFGREIDEVYGKVLASAAADYREALNKEQALKRQMDTVKRETVEVADMEFDYDQLKLGLDDKKRLLESLLQKQSQTDVSAQMGKNATMIRVAERAEVPRSVHKPNIPYNLGVALMFGLFVGIGLAFGADYLDRSLKNADDIERHVQLPFLGVVPTYQITDQNPSASTALTRIEDTLRSPSEATYLLTLYNPDSIASEAFKTVRASLLLSFPEAPPRTILVTSSKPGEGKTLVACNLAITLAQLNKRVVLVDADMRNPHVHRIWKLKNEYGLSNFLTSDLEAVHVVEPSRLENLSLVSSGLKTPRPAELLYSRRLDDLLVELGSVFDHVILDTPPVMPVADAQLLAPKCDCVVFVIHGGATPRDVVQMAKQKLSAAEAKIAGVVLNQIDVMDPYYYYSYYSCYGYHYGGYGSRKKEKAGT